MRFDQRGGRAVAALALVLGAALRIAFIRHAAPLTGDALIYGQIATNWMRSNLYGYSPGGGGNLHLTLIRLPGYPLFLILCFRLFGIGNYAAVMAVQCVVDLASCILVGLTARRLFGPRAGLLALTLAALCPFTANYVAAPLTETLTLFSIALAIYALTRWLTHPGLTRWLFVLAFALAYALLLRPEQALLTVAILPILWRQSGTPGWRLRPTPRLKALPAAAALLCILLPLVPWTIRNGRTFHVFQPLAPHYATDPGEYVPLGFQRWYRSWAVDFASTEDVYWNFDGAQIRMGDLPNRAFDNPDQRTRTAQVLADYNETTDSNPTIDARFEDLARERITAHPLRYFVELPLARLANMLLRPRTELMQTTLDWWNRREYPHDFRFAFTYAALNLLYLLLGLAGLIRWLRLTRTWRTPADPILLATVAFVLLRCALLLTLDNSEPRYTLELFPILCLWAGALAAQSSPNPDGTSHRRHPERSEAPPHWHLQLPLPFLLVILAGNLLPYRRSNVVFLSVLIANRPVSTFALYRIWLYTAVRVSSEGVTNCCFSETPRSGSTHSTTFDTVFRTFASFATNSSFSTFTGAPSFSISAPSSFICHAFSRSRPLPPNPSVRKLSYCA